MFQRAGEGDLRRRNGDWVRLALALLLLELAARHAGDVTASERALFHLFNTLPGTVAPFFRTFYRLGALWAVGLVVAASLVGRRWRLARDLLVGGVVAWVCGRAVGQLVVAHEGIARSVRIATGGGSSPAFPSVRLAVIVAVITVASPYVTRPTRTVGGVLVLGVGVSALYLGTAYPLDLFAGFVIGWGVGTAVHLIFGSPLNRPTIPRLVEALEELGIHARDARLAPVQPPRSTVVLAEDDDGPLRIKVISRDDAEARLLSKIWSTFLYRDSGPRLALRRVEQVEHEAYLLLVAARAGVTVPSVVAAGRAGPRAAVLVQRPVSGVRLTDLDPDAIDDELIVGVWRDIVALHRAGIAHGALTVGNVVVADGRPWLVGFDLAAATGAAERRARDLAEWLNASASVVGEDRAARAACSVLGSDLAAVLPVLQPAALAAGRGEVPGERRRALAARLERLRTLIAAAIGVDPPELVRVRRFDARTAAMAIGTLVAVGVLMASIDDPGKVWSTLRTGDWLLLTGAFALSLASNIAYAVGLQGTVPIHLPLWPTSEVELAMSFSNLAVPAIGGQAMLVRFLQKLGVDLSSAVAAVTVLNTGGALIASAALFVLALGLDPSRVDLSQIPTNGLLAFVLAVIVFVALASTLVAVLPRVRSAVLPRVRDALTTMKLALRSPRQLALLLVGNGVAILLSTWCLQVCLTAFGGHASFWALLAANIAVIGIASTIPVPGGGTAVGTVGLSAAMVSFGVGRDVAVAASLANQMVFYYLPAIPGWFATRHLARSDYL